jgi:hypothetical protein
MEDDREFMALLVVDSYFGVFNSGCLSWIGDRHLYLDRVNCVFNSTRLTYCNRDPVDNPTPKKIPPFYTKNPYFRSIISKQLVVRIIYHFKVAIRSSKNLII